MARRLLFDELEYEVYADVQISKLRLRYAIRNFIPAINAEQVSVGLCEAMLHIRRAKLSVRQLRGIGQLPDEDPIDFGDLWRSLGNAELFVGRAVCQLRRLVGGRGNPISVGFDLRRKIARAYRELRQLHQRFDFL